MVYLCNLSEKDYIRKKNKWWVYEPGATESLDCCHVALYMKYGLI